MTRLMMFAILLGPLKVAFSPVFTLKSLKLWNRLLPRICSAAFCTPMV